MAQRSSLDETLICTCVRGRIFDDGSGRRFLSLLCAFCDVVSFTITRSLRVGFGQCCYSGISRYLN